VPSARKLERVLLDEMLEMAASRKGAQILLGACDALPRAAARASSFKRFDRTWWSGGAGDEELVCRAVTYNRNEAKIRSARSARRARRRGAGVLAARAGRRVVDMIIQNLSQTAPPT